MKNKKIITLTIAIAAVILAGALVILHLFEATWNGEKEVYNNLQINEDVLQKEESSFNYPYTEGESDIYPPETALTYQQIVNICGEILMYIAGETAHRKEPAEITYLKINDGSECYRYRFSIVEIPDQYRFHIRANGDFITIAFERDLQLSNEKLSTIQKDELTENEKSKILETAKLYMDIVGIESKLENYKIRSFNNPKYYIDVSLPGTQYQTAQIFMCKTANGEYELEQIAFMSVILNN